MLLTVSISMALVMIQARGSIDRRAQEARETIGTAIQIRLLGASQGAGQPLTDADIQSLEGLEHVVAISKVLGAQYGGQALEPAIDPASFGDHGGGAPGVFGGGGASVARRVSSRRVGGAKQLADRIQPARKFSDRTRPRPAAIPSPLCKADCRSCPGTA